MIQSIPTASDISSLKQAEVQNQAAVAVARKSLDAAKAQGEAVISLLDAAVDVQNQQLAKATGKGINVDVRG